MIHCDTNLLFALHFQCGSQAVAISGRDMSGHGILSLEWPIPTSHHSFDVATCTWYAPYLIVISIFTLLAVSKRIQMISMTISFDTGGCGRPWACLWYSWIVISPKTDWVVSKTVSCSVPCSAVDFNGFYVTCPFSMGIAFWDYPSIPTWSVWFRHSKTVPISGFGYETDLLDTRNEKPLT